MEEDHEFYHKLQPSVECLLTGSGEIENRLENVMVSYLIHLVPQKPKSELEQMIHKIRDLATRNKESENGHLRNTLKSNSESENKEIARLIWDAYQIAARAWFKKELKEELDS